MDRESFVEALNQDLTTEFQSIVQYVQHTASIGGAENLSIVDELKIHLGQELEHAKVLAEQISFLEGTPTTVVAEVPRWTDSRAALRADLDLETDQLERYRSVSHRPTTWASRTSPKPFGLFSSRPRSTYATSGVLSGIRHARIRREQANSVVPVSPSGRPGICGSWMHWHF